MNPKYFVEGFEGTLSHVVSEMGEALQMIGKMQMYGPESYDPSVPVEERETNLDATLRELSDVVWSIERFRQTVKEITLR